MRSNLSENIRYIMIFFIIFSFLAFVVYCIYDTNNKYNEKIERITRNEYIFKFPRKRTVRQVDDEITLK